jgi:hypothetical protein
MRWDAYVYVPDPDALAAEFADHGTAFSVPLKDTHDGLRGFEICDPDGYVCSSADQSNGRVAIRRASCVSSPMAIAIGPTFRQLAKTEQVSHPHPLDDSPGRFCIHW